jgi:hypothetical protein
MAATNSKRQLNLQVYLASLAGKLGWQFGEVASPVASAGKVMRGRRAQSCAVKTTPPGCHTSFIQNDK